MTPVAVIFEAHRLNRAQRSHARAQRARQIVQQREICVVCGQCVTLLHHLNFRTWLTHINFLRAHLSYKSRQLFRYSNFS
jgi:hypothetical protein